MYGTGNKRKITPPAPTSGSSKKRLKKLILPPKAKNLPAVQKVNELLKEQTDNQQLLKEKTVAIENIRDDFKEDDKYYECTSCTEKLYPPYPPKLKKLIKKIHKNEQEYRKEQEENHRLLFEQCKKEGTFAPLFTYVKPGLSRRDLALICRVHKVELVMKPLAKEKGWPTLIEFDKIESRIKLFKQELVDIIDRTAPSVFLDKVETVHKELGSMKARQAIELINRFDETLPGYYGNIGSEHIMATLNDLFLKTDYITKNKTNPLTPIEFVQQVLVPECGIRFIKEDLNLDWDEAKKVMEESSEYGGVVNDKIKNKKE